MCGFFTILLLGWPTGCDRLFFLRLGSIQYKKRTEDGHVRARPESPTLLDAFSLYDLCYGR
jgi:hypothetical protein